MVKKCLLILAIMLLAVEGIFSQSFNIEDYFPMELGIEWKYTNSTGQLLTDVAVMNSDIIDGTPVFLFLTGLYTATNPDKPFSAHASGYGIKQNRVILLAHKVFGNVTVHNDIILAPPGETWEYNGEHFKAFKSQVSFDDKSYSDCICVETIGSGYYRDDKWIQSKTRTYYAKGIGKVYEEITHHEDGEFHPFDKLIEFKGK